MVHSFFMFSNILLPSASPNNLKEISLHKHLLDRGTLKVWDPLPNQILISHSVLAQGAQPQENRENFCYLASKCLFPHTIPQAALILYPLSSSEIFSLPQIVFRLHLLPSSIFYLKACKTKNPRIKGISILVYCLSHICPTLFTKSVKNFQWLDPQPLVVFQQRGMPQNPSCCRRQLYRLLSFPPFSTISTFPARAPAGSKQSLLNVLLFGS